MFSLVFLHSFKPLTTPSVKACFGVPRPPPHEVELAPQNVFAQKAVDRDVIESARSGRGVRSQDDVFSAVSKPRAVEDQVPGKDYDESRYPGGPAQFDKGMHLRTPLDVDQFDRYNQELIAHDAVRKEQEAQDVHAHGYYTKYGRPERDNPNFANYTDDQLKNVSCFVQ